MDRKKTDKHNPNQYLQTQSEEIFLSCVNIKSGPEIYCKLSPQELNLKKTVRKSEEMERGERAEVEICGDIYSEEWHNKGTDFCLCIDRVNTKWKVTQDLLKIHFSAQMDMHMSGMQINTDNMYAQSFQVPLHT